MVGSLVSRDTGKTGHTGLPFTVRASLARILGGIQTSSKDFTRSKRICCSYFRSRSLASSCSGSIPKSASKDLHASFGLRVDSRKKQGEGKKDCTRPRRFSKTRW